MKRWKQVVEQVVSGLADEALQRRAWFGIGPEESSPDEEFCMFFGDAAIEQFLERNDAGLTEPQMEAGRHLIMLMHQLSDATPEHIEPTDLIDDPRWREIRAAAGHFLALLESGNKPA